MQVAAAQFIANIKYKLNNKYGKLIEVLDGYYNIYIQCL